MGSYAKLRREHVHAISTIEVGHYIRSSSAGALSPTRLALPSVLSATLRFTRTTAPTVAVHLAQNNKSVS